MTNVIITFSANNVISIANNTGAVVVFQIAKIEYDGTFTSVATLSVGNGSSSSYNFGTAVGIFRVYNPTTLEANTIIIAKSITDHIEEDVKEILLSDDKDKYLPKGYDFVNLALMSIMFIGNSPFQNTLYEAQYEENYKAISEAISRCKYYLDRQTNTPQSSNKIWQ
jgi:hypothetical protein